MEYSQGLANTFIYNYVILSKFEKICVCCNHLLLKCSILDLSIKGHQYFLCGNMLFIFGFGLVFFSLNL